MLAETFQANERTAILRFDGNIFSVLDFVIGSLQSVKHFVKALAHHEHTVNVIAEFFALVFLRAEFSFSFPDFFCIAFFRFKAVLCFMIRNIKFIQTSLHKCLLLRNRVKERHVR